MADIVYKNLIRNVLAEGEERNDRTGVGTIGIFGHQMRFDLSRGFPLLTTKRIHFKSVLAELLWFLSGSTNNNDLEALGCTIWREWADKETGELGPVYGHQWRSWYGFELDSKGWVCGINQFDQISELIHNLKTNPYSRRHIISAWNVTQLHQMALPPCHCLFQFVVSNDNRLSCQLYQRSADVFLGVPFNIASYALLTHMIAQVCEMEVGEFIHVLGDAHIYKNHIDQVNLQLDREPFDMPKLWLNPDIKNIFDFKMEDVAIENYNSHASIKGDVAV